MVCLISSPPFPPSHGALLQIFAQTPPESLQTLCSRHIPWQGVAQVYYLMHKEVNHGLFFFWMHIRNRLCRKTVAVFSPPSFPVVNIKGELSSAHPEDPAQKIRSPSAQFLPLSQQQGHTAWQSTWQLLRPVRLPSHYKSLPSPCTHPGQPSIDSPRYLETYRSTRN